MTDELWKQERRSGSDYLLRNVPEELWLRAKHASIDEGISLRELLFRALEAHLSKDQEEEGQT